MIKTFSTQLSKETKSNQTVSFELKSIQRNYTYSGTTKSEQNNSKNQDDIGKLTESEAKTWTDAKKMIT